jgi:hypothetical protein
MPAASPKLFNQLEEGAQKIALKDDFKDEGIIDIVIGVIEDITGVDLTILKNVIDTIEAAIGGILDIPLAIVNGIADAINQFIADLLSMLDNATGGVFNLDALADSLNQTNNTAESKPDIEDLAVFNPLSNGINLDEDTTFDRSQLTFGASSGTAGGGSGDSTHTHSLSRIPDYQPAGGGSDMMEIAFIRARKTRTYTQVGFATGDAATMFDIEGAFLGVYSMDATTGLLTLLTPALASANIKGSVTTANKEFRFPMGVTINAAQGDIFAVALCQKTGFLQNCASLLCSTATQITNPNGEFPSKPYGYRDLSGVGGVLPTTLAHADINFGASTKLPFFVLG